MPPILIVSIDTEEEFNWHGPFSPAARSVGHVARLPRLQDLFESCGVRPTYLVTHPVATTPESIRVLDGFLERGACEIGVHLHPWVTPPVVEDICLRNSFCCNLPAALQHDKLVEMTTAVTKAFGIKPTSFKAGRYGFSFDQVSMLQQLGYTVDSSIRPYHDFRHEGGPCFDEFGPEPFWLCSAQPAEAGGAPPVLEVPCTVGFTRRPFGRWAAVHRLLARRPWRWLRGIGLLDRLGLMRKVALTPEGTPAADMQALMRAASEVPDAVLNLALHSPSIEPGHTRYVRNEAELEAMLGALRDALRFAVERLGARCFTLSEYHAQFLASESSRQQAA